MPYFHCGPSRQNMLVRLDQNEEKEEKKQKGKKINMKKYINN